MELKPGYKLTEVGVIPEDWEVRPLQDILSLKHGFAFSSDYFSNSGPIVLTPGNFRLEGGLYFEERNTKRYRGYYSPSMTFSRGDLLIVMTDLTPECNLLGKPAFVETNEVMLHNQRIGKVVLKDKAVDVHMLFYLLLSRPYLDRIKEQATGSTVRHTSNKSIYNVQLAWPPLPEQRSIATALSDMDELLGACDRLIAKKRDLKQATMQQLLTGKTRLPRFGGGKGYKQTEVGVIPDDWNVFVIDELGTVIRGASPRPKGDKRYYGGEVPRLMVEDVTRDGKFVTPSVDFLTEEGAKRSRPCPKGTLTLVCSGTVGIPSFLAIDACIHDGFLALINIKNKVDDNFLYHFLKTQQSRFDNSATHGGVFTNLTTEIFKNFKVPLPMYVEEQRAIATVLSDMDAEITALEQRRDKTRALKQAMMQELLTGRIRLV